MAAWRAVAGWRAVERQVRWSKHGTGGRKARPVAVAAAVASILLGVAAGPVADAAGAPAPGAAAEPATGPAAASAPAPPPGITSGAIAHLTSASGSYTNPLAGFDFPDPEVVRVGSTYYAFATGHAGDNVSEMSTDDLGSWPQSPGQLTDALPQVGSWAEVSPFEAVWAPSVIQVGGGWLLFYAAIDRTSGARCIGVASATAPAGPYQDDRADPLVCQPALGGDIDPDAYYGADGHLYLAWKSNDGSAPGPATLWGAALTIGPGGVSLAGSPTALVTEDQVWEITVENPAMVVSGGRYLLLFSGGRSGDSTYATGYAACLGPLGPCQQPFDRPVLASSTAVAGPGGASVFSDPTGRLWVAYAAWSSPAVGYAAGGARSLRIDPLCVVGGIPAIGGPTTTVQSLAPACPTTAGEGYDLTAADGGLFSYDTPFYGSAALVSEPSPTVASARDPATGGYWEVAADGGVTAFDAPDFGSMAGQALDAPIVGMAPTPRGDGYWLVAADGGIFAFGDAAFLGSMGGKPLNAPIVGLAVDRWTGGYWEVAADGGIFAFDAPFYGSMGGRDLNKPVVALLPAHGGSAYWEVASDGGIFSFGGAPFLGSTGAMVLAAPIVGGAANGDGDGYWLVASDGGVFAFGDAPFAGSMGGQPLKAPVVGLLAG